MVAELVKAVPGTIARNFELPQSTLSIIAKLIPIHKEMLQSLAAPIGTLRRSGGQINTRTIDLRSYAMDQGLDCKVQKASLLNTIANSIIQLGATTVQIH
jgi:hypothetical protein